MISLGSTAVGAAHFDTVAALLQVMADPKAAQAFLDEAKTILADTEAQTLDAQQCVAEANAKMKAADAQLADAKRTLNTAAKLAEDNAIYAAGVTKAKEALDQTRADLDNREFVYAAKDRSLIVAIRAFDKQKADTEAQLAARDAKLAADQGAIDDMKSTLAAKLAQIKALAG
jgi:multidrug resistance efflux pump